MTRYTKNITAGDYIKEGKICGESSSKRTTHKLFSFRFFFYPFETPNIWTVFLFPCLLHQKILSSLSSQRSERERGKQKQEEMTRNQQRKNHKFQKDGPPTPIHIFFQTDQTLYFHTCLVRVNSKRRNVKERERKE